MKYESDADGDLPVEVTVVDRNRFNPLHYLPVPYRHKPGTEEGMRNYERVIAANLAQAAYWIDNYFNTREFDPNLSHDSNNSKAYDENY